MGRPHIALPQQIANELNASNQMAAAQMQMREQRKLLEEQRQIEQQRYVERFIQNTAKDIFVERIGRLNADELKMVNAVDDSNAWSAFPEKLGAMCEKLAVALAKALGLLIEAEKEETNDAEVLGPAKE